MLEEKNIPPLPPLYNNNKIISKGFKNITLSDYPIRGRKTLLIFKRRYWKIEGEEKLLKRDIKLTAEGTLLEKEFAEFLKK
ncbi:MAG: transposase [Candidatus Aureabacteria bacterium]|nr:transposase [Candidatus Auribacterota bacterium]